MMILFRKMVCFLFGHRSIAIITSRVPAEPGWRRGSALGFKTCERCGHEERFQYDE